MTSLVGSVAMSLVVGVDYIENQSFLSAESFHFSKSMASRTVRACRRATVGVVTEGVDVEATLGVGVVAGNVP